MSDEIKADSQFDDSDPLFTVQAFDDKGERNVRAEELALKQGFVPGEKERAEGAAKHCNQLGLAGVTFKAVPAEVTQ